MAAVILDTKGWSVENVGGYWRHVNHARRLATSGWLTREVAERNANGYRGDSAVMRVLATRYVELFGDA